MHRIYIVAVKCTVWQSWVAEFKRSTQKCKTQELALASYVVCEEMPITTQHKVCVTSTHWNKPFCLLWVCNSHLPSLHLCLRDNLPKPKEPRKNQKGRRNPYDPLRPLGGIFEHFATFSDSSNDACLPSRYLRPAVAAPSLSSWSHRLGRSSIAFCSYLMCFPIMQKQSSGGIHMQGTSVKRKVWALNSEIGLLFWGICLLQHSPREIYWICWSKLEPWSPEPQT